MSLTLIRPTAHRIMPWKNGAGATAEIAICPPGGTVAGGFDWRLSIATVAADGPFSAFPDHDRVIMLLSGAGMALDFGDGACARMERPFQPVSFAGGRAVSCRLLDGPCRDLNLMVARSSFIHSAAVVDGMDWHAGSPGATRLLFVLRGGGEYSSAAPGPRPRRALAIKAGDTLLVDPAEPPPSFAAEPGTLAFAVTIRPCAAPDSPAE